MPQVPTFYISYGMPKSGSTLAFELTRALLIDAGIEQPKLAHGIVDSRHEINFIKNLTRKALAEAEEASTGWKSPLIIKTHSKLNPFIRKQLKRGTMIGHAVYRDPRDIALSMLDAAREGRAWGRVPSGTFRTARDPIPTIRKHLAHFLKWIECPGIIPLRYDRVAFDMARTCSQLAGQIGYSADIPNIMETVSRERFTQRNRGVPTRWKQELSPADQLCFLEEFGGFIDEFCSNPVDAEQSPLLPNSARFRGILRRMIGRQ